MKIISKINPKNLFKSKKTRSVSITRSSQDSSFSSSTSPDPKATGFSTPTSVLPNEISSDDWSELHMELVQAFKMIDVDGDGRITRSQLESLLSRVGAEPPSDEELNMMVGEIDRDGDGFISLEECGAISAAFGKAACDEELRDAFNFFDTNHDGKITAEELLAVFRSIGDERCTLDDCTRMISGVDKNGDGVVCFDDFVVMMELQR